MLREDERQTELLQKEITVISHLIISPFILPLCQDWSISPCLSRPELLCVFRKAFSPPAWDTERCRLY